MKFLCMTDLHNHGDVLNRIIDSIKPGGDLDMVLLGGDITHFGTVEDVERLVSYAQKAGAPVFAVAGNCDSMEIERRLVELGVSLHGRGFVQNGVGIHGLSGIPPWMGNMYQFTEEELAHALQTGYAQVAEAQHHVLLAHVPPHGCKLDRTFYGQHVGSKSLREFIEETKPELVLCGHIHEGRGIDRLGPTTIVNCGAAKDGFYALAESGAEVKVAINHV
jgi:uncharacterized protein